MPENTRPRLIPTRTDAVRRARSRLGPPTARGPRRCPSCPERRRRAGSSRPFEPTSDSWKETSCCQAARCTAETRSWRRSRVLRAHRRRASGRCRKPRRTRRSPADAPGPGHRTAGALGARPARSHEIDAGDVDRGGRLGGRRVRLGVARPRRGRAEEPPSRRPRSPALEEHLAGGGGRLGQDGLRGGRARPTNSSRWTSPRRNRCTQPECTPTLICSRT